MQQGVIEIRWHGRGGQGTVTAAKVCAIAAFRAGYRGVAMIPTFGTERRGMAVFASLKISHDKIYDLSAIEQPDIVVVLDHLLLQEGGVLDGLKPCGVIVINTPKGPGAYSFDGVTVAAADVTAIARRAGLPPGVVNTGIIGTFAKGCGLVPFDILLEAIEEEFQQFQPQENVLAARLCYEGTIVARPGGGG